MYTDNQIAQELNGETANEIDTHVIECALIAIESIYLNH
jgi:hypothetical protein